MNRRTFFKITGLIPFFNLKIFNSSKPIITHRMYLNEWIAFGKPKDFENYHLKYKMICPEIIEITLFAKKLK